MKTTIPATIVALLLGFSAVGADSLDGVYERVSLTNVRTGESPEAPNRQGLLIMAYGHYSMMTQNPDRRVLGPDEALEDMPESEQIAYLQEWLDVNAHTGRYRVDGDTLVWYRDISENPKEVGTVSRLAFEKREDQLVLSFTLPNGDRYEWVWQQLK
ncbi:MAG: hypothetical protein BMS9Abin37_2795 [Acidobacteriota bacterium]|nr:MAG: hypothetical protein BMS9Abin37_2795 [Acidobacteriota bacterium]